MPILEYQCSEGHITEKLFLTFAAAEGQDCVECEECGQEADMVPSVPFPAMFFGSPDGYHKPSPRKRYSTKLVSQKDGNKHAIG